MIRTLSVLLTALAVVSSCSSSKSAQPAPAVEPEPAAASATAAAPALIDIPNARVVDGMLLGGAPSPDQLRAAAKAGYRTVIDLRTPGEPGVAAEKTLAGELGLTHVALPVAGAAGLTDANVRALDQALRTSPAPIIVHCASGNRVGALLALRAAAIDGATAEQALARGKREGLTHLEPAVRARLGLPDPHLGD